MTKMTMDDIDNVNNEMLALSLRLNDDVIVDLESTCNTLKSLLHDVSFGYDECDKLQSLNKQLNDLQNDTLVVYDELKVIVSEVENIDE